jgi:hypothetical protein
LKLALLPMAVETPVTWRPVELTVVLDVETMFASLLWVLVTVIRPLQREQAYPVTALPMAVALVTAS